MGGGKGSSGPIYRPQHTRGVEDYLYKAAMGTAQRRNPSLIGGSVGQTQSYTQKPSGPDYSSLTSSTGPQRKAMMEAYKAQGNKPVTKGMEDYTAYGMDVPQTDYSGMMSNLSQGRGAFGAQIPQYQGYTPYQFQNTSTPYQFKAPSNVGVRELNSPTADAYERMQNQAFTGIQKAQNLAGAQANRNMASRGLGRGGLMSGAQSGLAREALGQMSNVGAQYGLEQAQQQVENERILANLGLNADQFNAQMSNQIQQQQAEELFKNAQMQQQLQQLQAAENLSSAQQQLNAQQILTGLDLNRLGAYGTLAGQQQQEAMLPYTLLSQLYGQSTGISPGQPGGKGSPFAALLGGAANIATGGMSGAASGGKG